MHQVNAINVNKNHIAISCNLQDDLPTYPLYRHPMGAKVSLEV